jgi:hypothetical protein
MSKEYFVWVIFKNNPPPHRVKVSTVLKYADEFSADCLVETGTYLGQMVNQTRSRFNKIISIELDDKLFEMAKEKFSPYNNISIIHGESDKILPSILSNIDEPIIYWLDAHYSGGITAKAELETPIMSEISTILKHPYVEKSAILIDDARLFTGANDYPSLNTLEEIIHQINPNLKMFVENDIIRIYK